MGCYLWLGSDQQGRSQGGESKAPNGPLLRLMLAEQGIKVQGCYRLYFWHRRQRLPSLAMRIYLLATWRQLLQAQLPLLEVVRLSLPPKAPTRLLWQLWQLQQLLQQGTGFALAVGQMKLLPAEDVALLAAAEEGGFLTQTLAQIGKQQAAQGRLRKQLGRNLLMPAVTLLVGVLVAGLLLLWLLPNMTSMLADQGDALPGLTRSLLSVAAWLRVWGGDLLVGLLGLLMVFWWGSKTSLLRRRLWALGASLPILGELLVWQQYWRLYHVLGAGMQGGVTLLRCLTLFAGACQLPALRQAVGVLEERLLAGDSLAVAFAQAGMPEQQVLMLGWGQRSGQVGSVCMDISEQLAEQIEDRLQQIQRLSEPVITLLLAAMVGSLVLAIYLPLLQLGTMLS